MGLGPEGGWARPTWLAHLLVPIWRLMVEWSMGGRIWFLGSYRCLLVPYAVMPDWLAHLLVPICREVGRRGQAAPNLRGHWVTGESSRPQWTLVPTWSPMTHWPAFMVASSKFLSCFSEYLMPMSTPLCSPFVLAWRDEGLGVSGRGGWEP